MKRKILIMTAAALLTLGLATVSAQSPAPAEEVPGELVYDVVEPQRYEAETPAYTVDANGNITLDVELNLRGDVDGDGDMDAVDINKLLRHVAMIEFIEDEYALKCCDVDKDGDVDATDINNLLRHVAMIEYLPEWQE